MADFVAYIKDNFSAYWQPEDIIRLRLWLIQTSAMKVK
jgi:hypothetical protein